MRCQAKTLKGKQCHSESAHEEEAYGFKIAICGIHYSEWHEVVYYGTLDDLEKLVEKWQIK